MASLSLDRMIDEKMGVRGTHKADSKALELLELTLQKQSSADADAAKLAYSKALGEGCKTVTLNPPVLYFLAAAKNDVSKAAPWLASYWQFRQDLFGKDNFFKPLTMTGNSSLTKVDADLYDTGFFVNISYKPARRPVVCYDRSRLERDFRPEDFAKLLPSIIRCVFYVISAALEAPNVEEHGIEILQLFDSSFFRLPSFDSLFQEKLFECLGSFPCLSYHCVVVCRPPRQRNVVYKQKTVPAIFSDVKKHDKTCSLVSSCFTDELVRSLEASGFDREELPTSVGGSWLYFKDFVHWRRERQLKEELMEATAIADTSESRKRAWEVMRKDSCRKDKRDKDREYARRKRKRVRDAVGQLEVEVKDLEASRDVLRQEFGRLSSLVVQAASIIQTIERPSLPNELVLGPHYSSGLNGSSTIPTQQQRLDLLRISLLTGLGQPSTPQLLPSDVLGLRIISSATNPLLPPTNSSGILNRPTVDLGGINMGGTQAAHRSLSLLNALAARTPSITPGSSTNALFNQLESPLLRNQAPVGSSALEERLKHHGLFPAP